jgi:hypothetical protein
MAGRSIHGGQKETGEVKTRAGYTLVIDWLYDDNGNTGELGAWWLEEGTAEDIFLGAVCFIIG